MTGSRHDSDTLWGSTRSLRISSSSQGAESKQSGMLSWTLCPQALGEGLRGGACTGQRGLGSERWACDVGVACGG